MTNPVTELLMQRVSHPRLSVPAPSAEVLENIFQTALRAPDHMRLRPWRYRVIQGVARDALGDVLLQAALTVDPNMSEAQQAKTRAMPQRAPLIIVGISTNQAHPKVPVEEQLISCGVGMGYMLLALQAEGFGGIWRTGPLATNPRVLEALGVQAHESLVGFLYVGTPVGEPKNLPLISPSDYFSDWGGNSSA